MVVLTILRNAHPRYNKAQRIVSPPGSCYFPPIFPLCTKQAPFDLLAHCRYFFYLFCMLWREISFSTCCLVSSNAL